MTTGQRGTPHRRWLALYRRLASAYPHEFRMRYGEDLDRLGEDAIPEIWRRYGGLGLVRLLADIAIHLPAQYLLEFRQDVVYALRMLAKSPGFAAVAVLSVGVGIGMCSAVLSECQSIAGPPPGIRDPAALVTPDPLSYPYFERYRDQHEVVESGMAYIGLVPFAVAFTADKSAKAERFWGHLVSPDYFTALGVSPAAGRLFDPQTEKPGMPPVVVVSDRFWRAHLGADPRAVGRSLRLNGQMATIVGIGPKGFLGFWPVNPADLFVPVTSAGALVPELNGDPLHRPDRAIFRVVLRLAHGVTIPRAEASLTATARILDREYGLQFDRDRKGKVRLMPGGTIMWMTPEQRTFVNSFDFALWALVLTLVCANLANLLLARGSARRREIAVRLSVGASRGRLIRQFLTESVLLSLTGGLIGVGLAYVFTNAIAALPQPSPTPMEYNCQIDLQVLAITLGIALAAGIGFGLAPALASARVEIGITLKEGAQAPLRGYRRFGMRNLFVVCQMAASLMLLLVTWYIVRLFLHNSRLDPGFDTANLNLIALDPIRDGYSPAGAEALFAGLPDELSRVNGVRGVAFAGSVPFGNLTANYPNTQVSAPVGGVANGQVMHAVYRDRISARYFATVGLPLVGGREFERRDELSDETEAIPAIVNQTAARELFGAADPIGRRIFEGEQNYTVVGVTRDVQSGFLITKPVAMLFLPLAADRFRTNPAESSTVLVRGTNGLETLAAVRNRLTSLHPDLTVFNVRSMRADLQRLNSLMEWYAGIYEVLGLFALVLASVGLGGVTAYAVARRQKEIGIRMALGARSGQVQALVLKEGTVLVAVGTVLGMAGAFVMLRAFATFTPMMMKSFGERANDPWLLFAAPLVLAGIAMLACYLPSRRATRIDPMSALRAE